MGQAPVCRARLPRLVVAGLSGDAGKTLVSLGLIVIATARGLGVRTFKKGPDYIDAAWLSWASAHPSRNLDSFLMGFDRVASSFGQYAIRKGLNVVEGNRGLYDGSDAQGTHSTAELAKTLAAPVILVVNATKATRTVAACVLGCQSLDPAVQIAGVVLNQVGSNRHERVLREAIENVCGVPIVGVLPRVQADLLLPGRHLGLVTPEEHPRVNELRRNLLGLVAGRLDFERLLEIAGSSPELGIASPPADCLPDGRGLAVGYVKDSAFTFYYPENLEALERAGACLVPFSSLAASELPRGLDALYIGGGFPETHAAALSANGTLLEDLRTAAASGLPIYAECGGLMLLSARCYGRGAATRWPVSSRSRCRSFPRRRGMATPCCRSIVRIHSSRKV
jgi:cobyrinic acid a,c-diamide synthase